MFVSRYSHIWFAVDIIWCWYLHYYWSVRTLHIVMVVSPSAILTHAFQRSTMWDWYLVCIQFFLFLFNLVIVHWISYALLVFIQIVIYLHGIADVSLSNTGTENKEMLEYSIRPDGTCTVNISNKEVADNVRNGPIFFFWIKRFLFWTFNDCFLFFFFLLSSWSLDGQSHGWRFWFHRGRCRRCRVLDLADCGLYLSVPFEFLSSSVKIYNDFILPN